MPHAHKAVTVQGVVQVLRTLGYLDEVLARVSDATKAVLVQPQTARFHPGWVLDETYTALSAWKGMAEVERVMSVATEQSLKGIIAPLARLFMTMMGGGPRALLQRFETLISGGTQGFTARWEPAGDAEGTLIIGTDDTMPPVADHAWKGAVAYLLRFAEVEGTVDITPRAPVTNEVRLHVKWTPRR
jgi:hypothetical protein